MIIITQYSSDSVDLRSDQQKMNSPAEIQAGAPTVTLGKRRLYELVKVDDATAERLGRAIRWAEDPPPGKTAPGRTAPRGTTRRSGGAESQSPATPPPSQNRNMSPDPATR